MSEWKPHKGPQENVLLRDEFEILYGGARGGGKTDAGMVWLLGEENSYGNLYVYHPRYRALILRKNAEDLTDWLDRASYMYKSLGGVVTGKPGKITFPSGATFRTGHLKDRKSYEKYLGHEYQRELVEELNQIPQELFYLQIMGSCRSTVEDLKPQIFNTTNPGGVGHAWVKERFVDSANLVPYTYVNEKGETKESVIGTPQNFDFKVGDKSITLSRIFVPSLIDDNPDLIDKDPMYVAYLESLKEKDPDLYRAWRWGDWNVFAGQFFKCFKRESHVIPPFMPDKNKMIVGGLDWGYTDNFACTFSEITIENFDEIKFNRVRTFCEIYEDQKNPAELGKIIKDKLSFFNLTLDDVTWIQADTQLFNKANDGGKSLKDLFVDYNDGFRCLKPADKEREAGWAIWRNWMSTAPDGMPYWQLTQNCVNGIRTIPLMIYNENKKEDMESIGVEDHWCDQERYKLKAIKWIDGGVGGVDTNQTEGYRQPLVVQMEDGKQIGIDLDLWGESGASDRVITKR